jgi:predicted TIM-barrel fold metal-dependent hydrolase
VQLDVNYPELFQWMGEVNLVKQALFPNGHKPTPLAAISRWTRFMKILRERDYPIAIHSDLGCDAKTADDKIYPDPALQCDNEPTKYLDRMDEVLRLYPDNKIVWVHMGLSKELASIDADYHISLMKERLDMYPNLMLDITWRVIYDNYFSKPAIRDKYVAFINAYSNRFLPGTDFVASRQKTYEIYAEEVQVNSQINLYLDDSAFRNIALGENYFRLRGMEQYSAPQICK